MLVRGMKIDNGENAGKVWRFLNQKGPTSKSCIIKDTKIKEKEFYSAVGWLARENKISRTDEDIYKLENTNLSDEIGLGAGRIWRILDIWGEVDITTIKKLSELNNSQIYTALGWLFREDKINFNQKISKYELKN
jgi:hypothetical protein